MWKINYANTIPKKAAVAIRVDFKKKKILLEINTFENSKRVNSQR